MDKEIDKLFKECLLTQNQKRAAINKFLKKHPQYEGLKDELWKPIARTQLLKAIPIIRATERWTVGEELCCLIGNLMLEDREAGILLGNQLKEYMKWHLRGGNLVRVEALSK